MVRRVVGAVLIVSLVTSGCVGCGRPARHSHGAGKLAAEYPARRTAQFGWTRIPAVYVLYSQREQPSGFPAAKRTGRVGWELTAVRLAKRSPLGFKVQSGSIVAVAGDDQIPLPPGEYCWHTRPNSEPIDWGATLLCVTVVGGVAAGTVAAIYFSTWDMSFGGQLK